MTDFGDAEAAVVAILAADPRLAGVTVATDLVGYSGADRWLRVGRTGGIPTLWMLVDNPVIAVAAYAPDRGAAFDLAGTARSAVYSAQGAYVGHGLALYDVMDVDGMVWSPDTENPAVARYVFTLALVTKPHV
jgi:hypothetical protein